jgi:hypothetical protein
MSKRLAVPGVIGAVLVAFALVNAWPLLQPPVQAAIISGLVAGGTALLAAWLLVWQIGKQAQNAIAANRTTEAIKLKKEVYQEFIAACRKATNAQSKVISYTQRFELAITAAQSLRSQGLAPTPPEARALAFSDLSFKASNRMAELVMLQERWEIIDPRTTIFREAFFHANYELREAQGKYYEMALRHMPHQLPDGMLVPWAVPDDMTKAMIVELGDALRHAYHLQDSYVSDLQNEMQNALLGELFDPNRVPVREPKDPAFTTVRLDRIPELKWFFANTPSGKYRDKVEAESAEKFKKA